MQVSNQYECTAERGILRLWKREVCETQNLRRS